MSLQTLPNQNINGDDWQLVLDIKGYVFADKKTFYAFGNSQPDDTITGIEVEPNTRIDNPDDTSLWIKSYYNNDICVVRKNGFV